MSTTPKSTPRTVADRVDMGKQARQRLPRREMGRYAPAPDRPSPVDTLAAQETDRVQELLPVRHERMMANPFAFMRGAAAVMAADLASMPNSGLNVQLCGDAHLSNLGLFAGPDRTLVFDLNDFDETHPGPFEWDVMRLAASFQVAAQVAGLPESVARRLPGIVAETYQTSMANFAKMSELDLWYYRVDTALLKSWAREAKSAPSMKAIKITTRAARSKDRWSAVRSLTTVTDGRRMFKNQPPLLVPLEITDERRALILNMYNDYRETLLVDRAEVLSRYTWVDAGHKVVGVGSVGLLAFVLLLQGRDDDDLLVLQMKQAVASVLEPYTAPSTWPSHGARVVAGQRLIQAATDAFLGYVVGPEGRNFYVRQLRDMKWSPDPLAMTVDGYRGYAGLCGLTLARAHARSGDAVAISSYVGGSSAFPRAISAFADAYTAQNLADYGTYCAAVQADFVNATSSATTQAPSMPH